MEMYSQTTVSGNDSVAARTPYPKVQVAGPNLYYANLLSKDLGGAKSEMTSACQYVYQGWFLERQYSNISATMDRIAVVEMHHLNLLGQMILLLGGDPQYRAITNRRGTYWDGRMVSPDKDPEKMILSSMELERAAIEIYSQQLVLIKDPYIQQMLLRILEDEKIHMKLFEGFLDHLSQNGTAVMENQNHL